jgi:aspartate aminotransferase
VSSSAKEAEILLSQLRILIRPMYSNPPSPGARIVETILGDKALAAQWCDTLALSVCMCRVLCAEGVGTGRRT